MANNTMVSSSALNQDEIVTIEEKISALRKRSNKYRRLGLGTMILAPVLAGGAFYFAGLITTVAIGAFPASVIIAAAVVPGVALCREVAITAGERLGLEDILREDDWAKRRNENDSRVQHATNGIISRYVQALEGKQIRTPSQRIFEVYPELREIETGARGLAMQLNGRRTRGLEAAGSPAI